MVKVDKVENKETVVEKKVKFDVDTSLPAVKLKKLRQFGVPLRAEI